MRPIVHALTPGDHFSPRTGSAIPTVVHGLATAASGDRGYTHHVLLERTTYRPRYDSAEAIEYTGAGYPASWERALDLGLSRVGMPRVRAQRSYRPLVHAMQDMPPSIVVTHNAPNLPGMLSETPHSSVFYGHNDLPRGMSRREATRMLAPAAAVVAVSEDLATRISDRVSATVAQRIHVVENGVDTAAFHPPQNPRTPGVARVMFVGRVVPEKGPDVLLRAVAEMAREDVEVVIVGSQGFDATAVLSPYERQLRDMGESIRGRVEFRPFVDREQLAVLLRSADVFVAPSRWAEPSGLTVGEAMATGLPTVASSIGGIPSVLGDAGMLVPAEDVPALAHALDSVLDDAALRDRLGARARRRAEDRSWAHSWDQLRAVLDSIG